MLPDLRLGSNRTCYRTFVNYWGQAGRFVEQHQWDAMALADLVIRNLVRNLYQLPPPPDGQTNE